jgi:adenylate cyclase
VSRPVKTLLLGLALTGATVLLYLFGLSVLHLMELKAQDGFFLARGPVSPGASQVVVVAVGERSLDRLGRWPWPRGRLAELVSAITSRGAKVVGLDIGFFEPDQRYPAEAVEAIVRAAQEGRPLGQAEVAQRFNPDQVLARALKESPCPVVMGWFFHMSQQSIGHLPPGELNARMHAITRFAFPAVRFSNRGALEASLLSAYAPEAIQPVLLAATASAGFFNTLPDMDGVVRRMPLAIRCRGRLFPSLALVCLALQLDQPLPRPLVDLHGLEPLKLNGLALPVDHWGRLRINYRGGRGVMPSLEAADVLEGKIPPGAFQGKTVLVGATATGLFDAKPTAFDPDHPALELQAQVLDNMLTGDFLQEPGWTGEAALAAMLLLGLGASLAMGLMRPWAGGLSCLLIGAGYIGFAYVAFLRGYLLSVVHPLLVLLVVGVGLLLYRYLGEEREKRSIREAFQHYLHPAVINEVLRDPGKLHLGGEKRELTVLFADVRNFVEYCEREEPETVAGRLNAFSDRMARVVLEGQGVLDKFMGDAVMAFWGAPVAQADHASRACRTALAMQAALAELNQAWQKQGLSQFRMGVGLSTGSMIVGNMGSAQYFDYTVVGQAVNLGSRLEEATKLIPGADIIVSQATRVACEQEFYFRPLDRLRLPGVAQPVVIHQLLWARDQAPAPEWLAQVEEAFNLLLEGRREESLELWQGFIARYPADGPGDYMVKRLNNTKAMG